MKTSRYLDPPNPTRPRIFAHRGFTFRNGTEISDENTLISFEMALQAGADYLETDVRVTKDGTAILFHDPNLRRMVGKPVPISSLTALELKQITLPRGGQIATLEEALEAFPNAKFNLDIKSKGAEAASSRIINSSNSWDRVLVSSFSEGSRIRTLAQLERKVSTSPGSSRVIDIYLTALIGSRELSKKLEGISALQLPPKMYSLDFTKPQFLKKIFEHHVEVHYWTINNQETMLRLKELGATGIVTDRTDLAVDLFS